MWEIKMIEKYTSNKIVLNHYKQSRKTTIHSWLMEFGGHVFNEIMPRLSEKQFHNFMDDMDLMHTNLLKAGVIK